MRCFGHLLAAYALVAVPALASEGELLPAYMDVSQLQGVGQVLAPWLAPSQERLDLEKSLASSIAAAMSSLGAHDVRNNFTKHFAMAVEIEQKLLKAYTRMKEIRSEIDQGVAPDVESSLRKEMKELISECRELYRSRQDLVRQSGMIPALKIEKELEAPLLEQAINYVDDLVLKPFEKYL